MEFEPSASDPLDLLLWLVRSWDVTAISAIRLNEYHESVE